MDNAVSGPYAGLRRDLTGRATMHRRDVMAGGMAALAAASFPSLAAAASVDYPRQPIRLVVPRSAGGVVDIVARLWAERAKQHLGNVIIENQGGGGGTDRRIDC